MNRRCFVFIALLMLSAAGCVEKNFDDEVEFDEEINRLDIVIDASNVYVRPSTDGSSSVAFDVDYRGRRPDYDIEVDGKTLRVRMECHFSCDGYFDVRVPQEVSTRISVDSGSIDLKRIEGPMTLSADSGNIKLEGVKGELDLSVDSGKITGDVTSEVCYGDVDSGSLSLRFHETPRKVDVSADSGTLRLEVPKGAYDIATSVDSGSRNIDNVTDDPDAPNAIRADVDSGKITIKGY